MKIGIIREGKVPPDNRVVLTPRQCAFLMRNYAVQIVVEPSSIRCYPDAEYVNEGVAVTNNLSDCDMLLGIKEVPITQLMPDKTYFFFSHTVKKQVYNRTLLQTVLQKNIKLIDYELLTDDHGLRLIAFGRYAGMVGAHNGMLAYGTRTGAYSMMRMKDLHDYAQARKMYQTIQLPPVRVVVTGTGRVASGAVEVLRDLGLKQVTPSNFLNKNFNTAIFTQLSAREYVERKDGLSFKKIDFYAHPNRYKSSFAPFYQKTDIFINGIFYDKKAPMFFTLEEMQQPAFKIKTIADISCDLMPYSSVPSTIRATTIAEPFYGFDPVLNQEIAPFQEKSIDMMTIDNLPNELPRDASEFFGTQFMDNILPEILKAKDSIVLHRATIAEKGKLTEKYHYLQDYVDNDK
jgi:saccharopine dehydrogenase (NAD+, L-lysine forming)